MRISILLLIFATLAACGSGDTGAATGAAKGAASAPAPAAASTWTLASGESRLSFVSTKAGEIAETHYFRDIAGAVSPSGEAVLEVALDSVETAIDIRNERMRAMLFETETHPVATVSVDAPLEEFDALAVGERVRRSATVSLSLHGVSADIDGDLFVTRIADDRVLVETAAPVVVNAGDFALTDGVAALMEIAALPSISPAVPTTASLVFVR
ncbi:MAG: YceI family protein [Pseudomonadota bacterium]